MKNFSDLLATNSRALLTLDLDVISNNGAPHCEITVNQKNIYQATIDKAMSFHIGIDFNEKISISISMSNKKYAPDRETAIVIKSLTIDSIIIVPGFEHFSHYSNDHHQDIKTSYLGYNGVWSLTIPEPFYHWRHRITGQGWLLKPTT